MIPPKPKPSLRMISLVTVHVVGACADLAVFDCIDTLTTSNGLMMTPSVTPAPRPAKANVYKHHDNICEC